MSDNCTHGRTLRAECPSCAYESLYRESESENDALRASLAAARARVRRLEEALGEVRSAIILSASDTVWMRQLGTNETTVDFIDAALADAATAEKGGGT